MKTSSESTWLERLLNRANDNRWAWFPLFSLRPTRHEFVTSGMVISLVLCAFFPAAAICSLGMFFYARWLGLWTTAAVVAAGCGFVFPLTGAVTYQYVSAYFWNRRAARFREAAESSDRGDGDQTLNIHRPQSNAGVERDISGIVAELAQTCSKNMGNPYRPPEVRSVLRDADGHHPFALRVLLYMHEVLFCHGSLLMFAVFCLWERIVYRQLSGLADKYHLLAVVSGIQGLLLIVLTVCLTKRQTWLGRRTFFLLKLTLAIAQFVVCCHPSFALLLGATLMLWPVDTILRCWFLFCAVLTMWSACVQWTQPERPVAPMFSQWSRET